MTKTVFFHALLALLLLGTMHAAEVRDPLPVPDLPGYKTLKGDFHIHTVFSDLYVFAGFSGYGRHERSVAMIGKDLFKEKDLLLMWKVLLGLSGYTAWECVGLPEEV